MRRPREDGWEPAEYVKDPTANAILNVAAGLFAVSSSIDGLLYALKFSKGEGMSVAEAIEKASENIAEGLGVAAESIARSVE